MAIEWCQVCGSSVWSGQSCGKCAHDGLVAARDAEIVRLKAEHDQALAACAEMRAALEGVLSEHEARVGECNCGICYPIHALLKKGGG